MEPDLYVETPRGPAAVTLAVPRRPVSLLMLGHGAGGDVGTVDLVTVRDTLTGVGVAVALVTQPYRVAKRRAPAPAGHLDEAWTAVAAHLTVRFGGLPLLAGGRSSGARVACRTAPAVGAVGVVALAFPLHPPGRPEKSRAAELATGRPTLVVNGDRDAFGVPTGGGHVTLHVIPGAGHDLRRDPAAVAEAVRDWTKSHGWTRG